MITFYLARPTRSFDRSCARAKIPSHRSPSVERFRIHVEGMAGSPDWLDGSLEVGRRRVHGARVVTTGDGLLATFDAPDAGIRCATAIREAVRTLGLEIRVGLHAGEYKASGADVVGLAFHIGARVAAKARAGEVVVSSAVKDLMSQSGIRFKDRGVHQLKGVPERWRLYRLEH
jgi:class 3 adenylate cyclase